MKLNHIDLSVANTKNASEFFIHNLGFKNIFEREDGLIVLLGEGDFALTLSLLSKDGAKEYPNGFHIGFNISDEKKLNLVCQKLIASGTLIARPMCKLGGVPTMQFFGPDNMIIEFALR